jgi:hypothetical protein|nr:FHA domain-containing protein [Kofleriaceae bacterium]
MRAVIASLLAVAAVTALAGPARAEVDFEVKAPDPHQPGSAPSLEVTVIGAPKLPADKLSLRDAAASPPVTLHATQVRDVSQGPETIAIAIVMNSWEMWVGNDDYIAADDPDPAKLQSRTPGALKAVEQAIDGAKLGDAGPAGSVGLVVTYGDKPMLRVPAEPLAALTGGQLGVQHDYYGVHGVEMVAGIDLALSKLHDITAARKVLIVLCDGHDANDDTARGTLKQLKSRAATDHVQTFAIIYKTALSDVTSPGNVITQMIPTATTVNTADAIGAAMQGIASRLGDRYYVTFAGWDPKLEVGLSWDGHPHQLVLSLDKDDQDPTEVTLAPLWSPPHPMSIAMLLLVIAGAMIAIGLVIVIVLLVLARRARRRADTEDDEVDTDGVTSGEIDHQVKTVMLGAGGDLDGYPVVGWLVPLDGLLAFHTFKLRNGVTRIGTSKAASDVAIDDGFMSTEHCQIAASPNGFMLIDERSTNGSYVNDHRVTRHELVDNDVLVLGKTRFKFKSIC